MTIGVRVPWAYSKGFDGGPAQGLSWAPACRQLLADRLLADRLLADRLLADRLLADRLLADRLLADRLLADRLQERTAATETPGLTGRYQIGHAMVPRVQSEKAA